MASPLGKILRTQGSALNGPLWPLPKITTAMNPYEIVKDPVLRRPGMSVPIYLILVLAMALIFALLVA